MNQNSVKIVPKHLPKLPIGIQSFEVLRSENFVYVDKTEHVYNLATQGSVYFLSRPRRFGKSLLCSTFKALFEAKKHLFEGTWIAGSDWQWQQHPIIYLSFASIAHDTPELLVRNLQNELVTIGKQYGVQIQHDTPGTMLKALILGLFVAHGPVVMIVDEYDKPIVRNLTNSPQVDAFKEIFKGFYGSIKDLGDRMRFFFLTGVSAFTSVSIFSDLNHMKILSAAPSAALLCGYTQAELETNYPEHIQAAMNANEQSREQVLEQLKLWYNGYSFTEPKQSLPRVYNPYSIINFFSEQRFANYWFTSGTPTFVLEYARNTQLTAANFEKVEVKPILLNALDTDNINITTVLYQSGYLTIKAYDHRTGIYTLGFPNYEVANSCVEALFRAQRKYEPTALSKYAVELSDLFTKNTLTEASLKLVLRKICAEVPSSVAMQREKDFQFLFWMALQFIGLPVDAEVSTTLGRLDAIITVGNNAYILELKAKGHVEDALFQIEDKRYAEKYANMGFAVTNIGILFDAAAEARSVEAVAITIGK